jgi:hypothetical protein
MSIAKKSAISVAAAVFTVLLAAPAYSVTPVQNDTVRSSAKTVNPDLTICFSYFDWRYCITPF